MRRRFIEDVVVVAEHRSPGYDAAHPETGDRYGPWRCAAASDAPNSATATCRSGSVIAVEMPTFRIGRQSINQIESRRGILNHEPEFNSSPRPRRTSWLIRSCRHS